MEKLREAVCSKSVATHTCLDAHAVIKSMNQPILTFGGLHEQAAGKIQCASMTSGLIAPTTKLKRTNLVERLELELSMQRGLRLLFLCMALFTLVVLASVIESASASRFGLLQTYQTIFGLDDSLADIKTVEALKESLPAQILVWFLLA